MFTTPESMGTYRRLSISSSQTTPSTASNSRRTSRSIEFPFVIFSKDAPSLSMAPIDGQGEICLHEGLKHRFYRRVSKQ